MDKVIPNTVHCKKRYHNNDSQYPLALLLLFFMLAFISQGTDSFFWWHLIYLSNFSRKKKKLLKGQFLGMRWKKCNTISASFSVQNEHSLSSLGDSHSLTPTSSPVSTSRAPLEQLWDEQRCPCLRAL